MTTIGNFDLEAIKGLMAIALLEISAIPNIVVTLNKEGIRIERINENEDPTDNYMVLSPNFGILEQQFGSYVNDINFPVLWYNKVINILGLYSIPYDEG